MKKRLYQEPQAVCVRLMGEGIVCTSGNLGDYGIGTFGVDVDAASFKDFGPIGPSVNF